MMKKSILSVSDMELTPWRPLIQTPDNCIDCLLDNPVWGSPLKGRYSPEEGFTYLSEGWDEKFRPISKLGSIQPTWYLPFQRCPSN